MESKRYLKDLEKGEKTISVLGLGYVGLPLALTFAKKFNVIGFDINEERIEMMKKGVDPSKELSSEEFKNRKITFTADASDLAKADFHIVAVPTPISEHKTPNLTPILGASHSLGPHLKKGDYIIYESTVYPGCTEEDCIPILENESGLRFNKDFKVGYSPERINPGDKERTLENILKIVSGCDEESLNVISAVYGSIIKAGIYEASSIKVAEAAKVIENTQRDLNISFMNELAIIFDSLNIDTKEVLEAAGTKWNFIRMHPGLVGGHCIGVDPYYLLHKSKEIGYDPQVIAAGRRINDHMPSFIAKKLVQKIIKKGKSPSAAKVLIMGITFKENVADIRNSKVSHLAKELMSYSINVHLVDPHASPNEVAHEYNLTLTEKQTNDYDAVIVAVNHKEYVDLDQDYYKSIMSSEPILFDIKSIYNYEMMDGVDYWRL